MHEIIEELRKLISTIPYGKVTTFKILSEHLGDIYSIKFIINYYKKLNGPWWRVVNSDGIINDKIQEELLKKEGIEIINNKIVNLEKYLFDNFNIKEKILKKYRKIQEELASKIILEDNIDYINLIGGVDLSYKNDIGYVVYVILDKNLKLINKYIFKEKIEFPYIPSFLAFREGEPIIKTFNKIKEKIHILFINGHGISHPFKLGLASYVGVNLNIPTIGLTKKLLFGNIIDNKIIINNEVRGYKIEKFRKIIYASPGNLISLEKTKELSEKYWISGKYPEPIRLADMISKKIKYME
ncbi:MAG: endonuclease V [Candidatus Nanopusillus sp.]